MKNLIKISALTFVLATSARAQTYLSEDFELGLPVDWTVGVSIPAVTTWHALFDGECMNATAAVGFTGANCQTGARGFPSTSFLTSPTFNLSGPPPYRLEFDSTLLMDLSFDSVSVSVMDSSGTPTLLADGFAFTNTGLTEAVSLVIPASFGGLDVAIFFGGNAISTSGGLGGGSSGGLGWLVDNLVVRSEGTGDSFCSGDGGDQLGCTPCPCNNNAPMGSIGGCLNSAGTSARLASSGDASISLPPGSTTDFRFELAGAPALAFCILNSGDAVAPGNPANPCFGLNSGAQAAAFDGLRCAITNTRRHGGRSADANGDVGVTNNPWGGEGGPPVGIAVAGGGFAAGQTRYFQVINRDDPLAVCQRGLNTSQAVEVTFTP